MVLARKPTIAPQERLGPAPDGVRGRWVGPGRAFDLWVRSCRDRGTRHRRDTPCRGRGLAGWLPQRCQRPRAGRVYGEVVTDREDQGSDEALQELAAETERAFDQAVDATTELARGKTVDQVDDELRVELRRLGVEPDDTRDVAKQIVAGLRP